MRLILNTLLVILVTTAIFSAYSCVRGGIHDELFFVTDVVEPPTVRVALTHGTMHDVYVPEVSVSVDGPVRILSLDHASVLKDGSSLDAKLSNASGSVKVHQFVTGHRAVRITPSRPGTLRVNRRTYYGDLIVMAEGTGKIGVINEVDMENYIAGVIGPEIGLSSSVQTLKAQAIAARTYAMYEIKLKTAAHPELPFDVYDDQRSQVYLGTERTDAGALQIIRETRGTFLTYQNRIFKSFYSSTCGGHTEPARDILGEGATIPPLSGRRCDFCKESRYYSWKAAWTRQEIVSRLREHFKDVEMSDLVSIAVSGRAPGGHATKVTLTLEPGRRTLDLHAYSQLRRILNTPTPPDGKNIRSTWFDVTLDGSLVRFTGRGWGHAVGLCQVGAQSLGKLGYSATDILKFYYPAVEVMRLY